MQTTDSIAALVGRGLASLRARSADTAALLDDSGFAGRVGKVIAASDFALETLRKQPGLLATLKRDDGAGTLAPPLLSADDPATWPEQLRLYRAAESTRLVWRDALELDEVDAILAGSTRLAENCMRTALEALETEFAQRHGVVRAADGSAQRLVVFGLGKLGGGELNFSSDIDLVYAYPQGGESDGARPLAAEDYFARLGQRLAKLLDEPTVDGFSHRVDLRLRPFGNAGRVALSFAGMDQYFQREGRDWERYAWLKARAVAGDTEAGEQWLQTLRPFVYRRYLDFTALDGLRDMKAAIAAEVARRELADDIKRGPGGIREIEFLAQALQLIHGGREAALRERRLLPALCALMEARQISQEDGDALIHAYRFLRKLENRLQMLRDAQTHALPENALDRARIARGLGYPDWNALNAALAVQRERVAAEFSQLLAPRQRDAAPGVLTAYWRALPGAGDAEALAAAGFVDPASADAALRDFANSSGVLGLSDGARARLDRVLPALLEGAARSSQPDAAVKRLLVLLRAILRRASYLALLDEQPSALNRLVDVVARSALLAERLALYPLLLDELLDTRVGGPMPDRAVMRRQCEPALQEEDPETALRALNEQRLALSFRIALAALDGRQNARDSTRQLAWLAEEVVRVVLRMAHAEVVAAHGEVAGGRFAVIGYGSLGGEELGFGSDLDLVFLFDADTAAVSSGARSLEAGRWYARLAQKLVALLGAATGAGRLYEVDVRLRPDGAKGLLVSSLSSYRDYQRERAWTWEHQALVRARGVAGDASLLEEFEAIRAQTLSQARDVGKLREEVGGMRLKMRAELDRSDAARFDLKQGAGGLVDLEFLLQFLVLRDSSSHAALLGPRDTQGLIDALRKTGTLDETQSQTLLRIHDYFVSEGLNCTLDRRPRLLPESESVTVARLVVSAAARAQGLVFDNGAPPAL
ncbi:bifunctional [glutamate--ammonia ligase]-adenylyl-L-tyrosine phosphorylase/[glutamate--ammonia-ligase] adenylyltransferase [Pseudoxanthomonas sacheonensis]|uniref:bifunctional [glutamate--ammonia ligase]-adenylyl-L-tyrosine phosphorylase/[glutamate--ammonia-ligase] adenylyltransferase n=1 Tax=Pseudoxanthomonas sacheonensis TaxID=443615 RepID=UPI0013D17FED|nr:bifunctional [glutamate--ammonia ligase]-adenylyl-L-tyrosine phosphorylase/[glutamate--ammonia-ligase] adenylyltransferase [Pseudoxanthomonas sacheonensis]KAF1708399.1 bifunctional [glutamate--ammonia ligase]-adenylyl-L-tyrosine phosphorylase/[glutamate--ammonia-ligase] adenylyltransferase [Pseudoxanthomonas sacheonensis]